ncbi:dynamin family protein [Clostridium sp. CX1]|uniref:dynamin family protein n=1 Tax=Clostridium sp. CX1 TaxID=2978346 RepID=UPI0021C0684A|nr:dynamin family protein [Clostridium sp. CX1]MCT8977443.1 dynamin family protein [Clostridium sp. CX1]
MDYDELEFKYNTLNKQFELFKSIVKPNNDIGLKVDLSKLEKIINEHITETLKKNAPPNFPELFYDFKYEYSKFREFILYDHLIGRNIVGLGGGFSSGKSSFLNSLMDEYILPEEIDPSTSVPSYIVYDKETAVYGVNIFDSKLTLRLKDIRKIAHGFGEEIDEVNSTVSEEITLGHILKSMFIATPLQEYKHIAFLDTPGYSKPDTEAYSAKTDEKIARAQLNSSNYIIWFVQATDGTIREEDINFINTLKQEIPKLIIVNKADKVTKTQFEDIVKEIKNKLDVKGIGYLDVLTYSSNEPTNYDSKKIKEYILNWDTAVYEATFAHNFKVLFVKCKEYYENVIDEESRRLNRLQKALTLSDDTIVTECLTSLVSEIKRNISELKNISQNLKKLQDEFFSEIKYIADLVSISMPEPSEIDLIKDKVKDPLEVLEEFKKKQGINNTLDLTMILRDTYRDINPVINRTMGNSNYKEEIYDIIEENFVIDKNKIKFGK